MSTTITRETIKNVKTIEEAKTLVDEAFVTYKDSLKSVSVFVWSERTSGIEVKVSSVQNTEQ